MGRIVAVTGTGTGVGKTVLTAALCSALRRHGMDCKAVKAVATGVPPGEDGEDAELLRIASGGSDRAVLETFVLPRSPLAAAAAEGRELDLEALARTVEARAAECDLLLVEGVGGLLVPLTPRRTVRDLLRRLDVEVVIAALPGLGTINHTALTVEAARGAGLRLLGVVLVDAEGDQDPELVAENAARIAAQCGTPVLGVVPHLGDVTDLAALADAGDALDLAALLAPRPDATARVVAADRRHAWHPFTQTSEWRQESPLVIRSGEGCWLVDEAGRRYLDGISSLWCTVHGHAHPALDRAAREQLGRIAHSTFLGQTHAPGALLAEELAAVAPEGLERVFYCEAGAAAVEAALRIALLAQRHGGHPERTDFVALGDAYHGDTAGAVSVGRSEPFHTGLDPILFAARTIPSPHLDEAASLRALAGLLERQGDRVAALIVEPRVQAASGMLTHSDGWLREAAGLARRHGALLIADEVATGFGRTGDLFAVAGAAVQPDILCLGKGLSGGYLPLSAVLVTEEVFDRFTGTHTEHRTLYYGHTYTGNPVACAVARASLRLFDEEGTLGSARRLAATLGRLLAERVAPLPGVFEIRRRGVMTGIELRRGRSPFAAELRVGRRVILAARERGVVVRPLADTVVLNPPLILSDGEAEVLVGAVAESISEVVGRLG
ncbi:MAG: adenosylmethionine--8-amino-7-oxononanoate transaminase [Candidatus Dormibacteria bacterium]